MATKHKVVTTDAEIDAAIASANDNEPRAVQVNYLPSMRVFVLKLNDGTFQAIPRDKWQDLEDANVKELSNIELLGDGTGLRWPDLDVDLYVPALVKGIFGTKQWMANIGRRGGSVRSEAKRAASRVNGVKGGRPRKPLSDSLKSHR
jgi:hypothetical protein